MEMKIDVPSPSGGLEGLLHSGDADKGVVITHPHPKYGGDMYSPVGEALAATYRKQGYTTLRFNFRGTGNSAGSYAHGIGEREDVKAAVALLRARGLTSIHLSGYSFGAWVNAMTLQEKLTVDGLTMVAPPVAFIDFKDDVRLPMLSAVVAGSRDEFAPPDLVRPLMHQWHPGARLDIIDGADHSFFGFLDDVTHILAQRLRQAD